MPEHEGHTASNVELFWYRVRQAGLPLIVVGALIGGVLPVIAFGAMTGYADRQYNDLHYKQKAKK